MVQSQSNYAHICFIRVTNYDEHGEGQGYILFPRMDNR